MNPDDEQRKADRVRTILYFLMAILIVLPFVLFLVQNSR